MDVAFQISWSMLLGLADMIAMATPDAGQTPTMVKSARRLDRIGAAMREVCRINAKPDETGLDLVGQNFGAQAAPRPDIPWQSR